MLYTNDASPLQVLPLVIASVTLRLRRRSTRRRTFYVDNLVFFGRDRRDVKAKQIQAAKELEKVGLPLHKYGVVEGKTIVLGWGTGGNVPQLRPSPTRGWMTRPSIQWLVRQPKGTGKVAQQLAGHRIFISLRLAFAFHGVACVKGTALQLLSVPAPARKQCKKILTKSATRNSTRKANPQCEKDWDARRIVGVTSLTETTFAVTTLAGTTLAVACRPHYRDFELPVACRPPYRDFKLPVARRPHYRNFRLPGACRSHYRNFELSMACKPHYRVYVNQQFDQTVLLEVPRHPALATALLRLCAGCRADEMVFCQAPPPLEPLFHVLGPRLRDGALGTPHPCQLRHPGTSFDFAISARSLDQIRKRGRSHNTPEPCRRQPRRACPTWPLTTSSS